MPERLQNVSEGKKMEEETIPEEVKLVDVNEGLIHEQPNFGPSVHQNKEKVQLRKAKVKFDELKEEEKDTLQKKFKEECDQISKVSKKNLKK